MITAVIGVLEILLLLSEVKVGKGGDTEPKRKLTRRRLGPLGHNGLVPPNGVAQRLVPGADGYDSNQGDDEAHGGGDVPLAEDDAEVVGRPGEEHLVETSERWGAG